MICLWNFVSIKTRSIKWCVMKTRWSSSPIRNCAWRPRRMSVIEGSKKNRRVCRGSEARRRRRLRRIDKSVWPTWKLTTSSWTRGFKMRVRRLLKSLNWKTRHYKRRIKNSWPNLRLPSVKEIATRRRPPSDKRNKIKLKSTWDKSFKR